MARALRFRLLPFALIATLLSGGCVMTTTATISVPGEPPLEAKIVSSDVNSLHLEDDVGNPFRLGHEQVSSIDHPGSLLALIGVVYLSIGSAAVADYYTHYETDASTPGRVALVTLFGWTSLILGTALTATGTWYWLRSRRAARAFESGR